MGRRDDRYRSGVRLPSGPDGRVTMGIAFGVVVKPAIRGEEFSVGTTI